MAISKVTKEALQRARAELSSVQAEIEDAVQRDAGLEQMQYTLEEMLCKTEVHQLEQFASYELAGIPAGHLVELWHGGQLQGRGISRGTDKPDGHDHSFIYFKWQPNDEPPDLGWRESRENGGVACVRDSEWVRTRIGSELLAFILSGANGSADNDDRKDLRDRKFWQHLKDSREMVNGKVAERAIDSIYGQLIAMMDPKRRLQS